MLATAVSPAIGHAAWSLELPSSSSTTLDNGRRVISVQYRPHLPIVRVDLIVDAGAVDAPPGKEGLAEPQGPSPAKGRAPGRPRKSKVSSSLRAARTCRRSR